MELRSWVFGGVSGALCLIPLSAACQDSPANNPSKGNSKSEVVNSPAVADRSADETVIRANITAFVKAYNAKDAKALAALFTTDGCIIDKEGTETRGRESIAKAFGDIFAESPRKKLEVSVESIRFVSSELAVESGTTKETESPGETPDSDKYTVLHVKRDGKWLMALARDEEGSTVTANERLRPLSWLVGEWVDDGGSVVVYSSCRFSEDKNFLLQEFKIKRNGRDEMKVSQRIGWDPLTKHIRSWVFDSEGGFGEGVWVRDADGWVIKATGVRSDGVTASATNQIIPTGKDGYLWRSTDRIIGDDRLTATQVKVVRKPPQPEK